MLTIVQVVLTAFLAVAISVAAALTARLARAAQQLEKRSPMSTDKNKTKQKGGGPGNK